MDLSDTFPLNTVEASLLPRITDDPNVIIPYHRKEKCPTRGLCDTRPIRKGSPIYYGAKSGRDSTRLHIRGSQQTRARSSRDQTHSKPENVLRRHKKGHGVGRRDFIHHKYSAKAK